MLSRTTLKFPLWNRKGHGNCDVSPMALFSNSCRLQYMAEDTSISYDAEKHSIVKLTVHGAVKGRKMMHFGVKCKQRKGNFIWLSSSQQV